MKQLPLQFDKPPAVGDVYALTVSLQTTPDEYRILEASLAPMERARADRFQLDDVRRRFVVCRGRLRELLAHYAGCQPKQIAFGYGQWGKPFLQAAGGPALQFNVTHSGDWAAIAVSGSQVGIDLEFGRETFSYRSLAGQVLSPQEQARWRELPARHYDEAMLQLWVCKEALLKAMGLGIADCLHHIAFSLPIEKSTTFRPAALAPELQLHLDDDGSCRMASWIDPASWRIRWLDLLPNAYAALAIETSNLGGNLFVQSAEGSLVTLTID